MALAPYHAGGTFTAVRYIQLPITNRVRTNYVVLKINEHQNKMTYRETSYFNPAHLSETLINVISLCLSVCLSTCLFICLSVHLLAGGQGSKSSHPPVWIDLINIPEDGIRSNYRNMIFSLSHTNATIHRKKRNALHIL